MGDYNRDYTLEYRHMLEEMVKELDNGCQPDKMAMNHLKIAKGKLRGKATNSSLKRKRSTKPLERLIRVRATEAIWKNVLLRYTKGAEVAANGFRYAFTQDGVTGYNKFMKQITIAAFHSVDAEESLIEEEKEELKIDMEKYQGWLSNIALNLQVNVWDYLKTNLVGENVHRLGDPTWYLRRRESLEGWTKELVVAKTGGNNHYANKIVTFGNVSIESGKKGTRPSRSLGMRMLYFLRPDQVVRKRNTGSGVQGNVFTCNVKSCPTILENVVMVAKKSKGKDNHKKRADALQEVMMGGLDHKGIVGACAMTIEDPPRLLYDYYNGGDLARMMEKCKAFFKGNSKQNGQAPEVDAKWISEKKYLWRTVWE